MKLRELIILPVIVTGIFLLSLAAEEVAVKDKNKSDAQIMLQRALYLDKNKIADIFQVTGEILYSLHKSEFAETFKIPPNAVLDTAIGVDPLITKQFTGTIYFEISATANNGPPQTIFKKDIDLSSMDEEDFGWQKVTIDLSGYSGREITLNFNKGFEREAKIKLKIIYDLLPTDFMYWRLPVVRPASLKNKYNVILISLDALRSDHLHFMGYPRETSPNLDRLAHNGIYFTTAISQAPWTTPSHFSILTSTYPSTHKNNQPFNVSPRRWNGTLPTIAGILRDKGYVTSAFTGSGFVSAKLGFCKGFDFYDETTIEDGSDVEPIFNKSMEWLNENKDKTFFLFIHTYEPHEPYKDDFFTKNEKIDESKIIEYKTAKYDGDIRRTDLYMGKLVKKLNELGLVDNTLVVTTSDHGEDMGGRNPPEAIIQSGHGYNLFDELLLVPLIFYNPKLFPRERRIDYQVRSIDIIPTIIDYLGCPAEKEFQGKSLKGMIEGRDQLSRPAYSEATTYGTERESIRADGYKYIRRISYGQLSTPASKGLDLTAPHELYNLDRDPDEKTNLAEEQEGIVKKYQDMMRSILPEKILETHGKDHTMEENDLKKDKGLMKNLRSLGYIQ